MSNLFKILLKHLFAFFLFSCLFAQPEINVSPDSFYTVLYTGTSEQQIMTIANSSQSDNDGSFLSYEINSNMLLTDNYALHFDGLNDFISFDNQSLESMLGDNWSNEKTISVWIKPEGVAQNIFGGWDGGAVYGQVSGSGNYFGISRGIIDGEDRIWIYNWDGDDDRIGVEYNQSEWVHIALVHDNSTLYGYKNGQLIGQVNTGSSLAAGYQRVGGGTENGGFFQGSIDELRVWNYARNQAEIEDELSTELFGGFHGGLVGYWKFNEAEFSVANDESSNDNHGYIYGSSWVISDALLHASWLEISPTDGILNPGQSNDIVLHFDAEGLNAGVYENSLLISSNDSENPELEIPILLEVAGTPGIDTFSDTLDFGMVFLGYSNELILTIVNIGTDELILADFILSGNAFSIDATSTSLQPGDLLDLQIAYTPQSVTLIQETLTILSNDPDNPDETIILLGNGISPPIIHVDPISMVSNLETGETETQTLTISNMGESDLSFFINTVNVFERGRFEQNYPQDDLNTINLEQVRNIWNSERDFSVELGSNQSTAENVQRPLRNWQLLINDPQDNDSPYDTEAIYYELSDTSIHFKYQYYEPWEDPYPNTVSILHINIDNDNQTGAQIANYEGIDMLVYSFGLNLMFFPSDGVYLFEMNNYGGGFNRVGDILWDQRDTNSNEFSYGISNEYFDGLRSMELISWSGSLDAEPDVVPNDSTFEFFFKPIWLSLDYENGLLAPGDVMEVNATFDPLGLFGGQYQASIEIISNDPSNSLIEIPVSLNVTGFPAIEYPDQVDFGQIYVGYPDTLGIGISNTGTDLLLIDNIIFQDDWLISLEDNLEIEPAGQGFLNIIANIDSLDSLSSSFGFSTNDPSNQLIENILISAYTVTPAIVDISHSEFEFTHNSAFREDVELVISNSGGVPLIWNLDIEYQAENSTHWVFFEKSNNSDPSLEQNQDRISNYVWLTKDVFGPMYNVYQETEADELECYFSQSPSGTLWSPFPKEDSQPVHYLPFLSMTSCCPSCIIGDTVSVWLQEIDLKINVVFESWIEGGQGGYSYYREQAYPRWLNVSEVEGIIQPQQNQSLNMEINSSILDEGEYSLDLNIYTNDPENEIISIPMNLVRYLNILDNYIPNSYKLHSNYPNPFNPTTKIKYDLPQDNMVTITIHDIMGRNVTTLMKAKQTAGFHSLKWDAKNNIGVGVAAGIYIYTIQAGEFRATKKMVLLK